MTIHEMQSEIVRLKKENDICILAHSYQGEEICEVADFVGEFLRSFRQSLSNGAKERFDVWCAFYGGNGKDSFAGQARYFGTQRSRMSHGRTDGQG